jgi:hypothetical protein
MRKIDRLVTAAPFSRVSPIPPEKPLYNMIYIHTAINLPA